MKFTWILFKYKLKNTRQTHTIVYYISQMQTIIICLLGIKHQKCVKMQF